MRRAPLCLTSLGLLLSACNAGGQHGLETAHQPVVSQTDYALDLAVSRGQLAADEDRRLDGWARNLRLGYGDRVTIEDPAGEAPGAYRQVAAVIGAYGLLLGPSSPIAQSPVAPATIRVIVTRARATVPGCPDWRSDLAPDWSGDTSSNHGCAINRNLAAMVADPRELVRGTDGPATADPRSATRAIVAMRRAGTTGTGGTTLRDPNATASSGPAPTSSGEPQ
ncbi:MULTISPECIES: CpaD family pilus assembly lipoprotein [unclassified Sphingomonas]|uniref:CpaD family pilus assembly protein n=1 Tax=unclassified Sphingomonas TaxID=196159 RepID=UPI00285ADB51|nr:MULTISPECIES: CpaD family pilus assembly lipoprotein [unclassified Sphingomonas]MDR6113502.1 pilus assembly protein CpaD [Sphingomonas sp. SORGH_AS_0789]MDR6149137.1 pilus assembly protein CpaD [Sphingomonas sp. SORGH_AS_0742]